MLHKHENIKYASIIVQSYLYKENVLTTNRKEQSVLVPGMNIYAIRLKFIQYAAAD